MIKIPNILKKSNKMFRSFLYTYTIFLVIILCIGLLSIWISSSVIEEQVGQIYAASLEQVSTAVDNYIIYASKTASELMFNNRVQTLQMAGDCDKPQDVMTMTYLQQDIRNAMVVNPTISRMSIYFPAGGYVLDNMACYRTDMLERWSDTYFHRGFSVLDRDILDNYSIGRIITLINPETNKADIVYSRTLGDYPVSTRQPMLLITLKGQALSAILREYEQTMKVPVFLVMDDGTILDSSFRLAASSGDDRLLSGIDETLGKMTGSDDNYITHIPSSVMNAKYVGVVPRALYLDRVNHVINIIMILLAGFIVIGIALAVFFSKRSSRPLEKMSKLLRSSGKVSSSQESIYAYIEQTLTGIISENRLLEKNLDKQKQEVKEFFLVRLARGNVPPAALQKMLEHYNIELDGELVIATAYILDDAGPHFSDCVDDSQNPVNFSVRNAVEELTLNKFDCFICNLDNAVLCVSSSSISASEFSNESIAIAQTVTDFFERKLGVKLAAFVSRAHPGIMSVPQACQESLEAIEYRAAAGKGDQVCCAADSEDSVDTFGYSIKAERLFINCIKCGDFCRAKERLSGIIEQCRAIKSLPLMKVRMAGLAGSVLSAVMEYENGAEVDYLTGLDPVRTLIETKNIDVLERNIRSILDSIIKHSEEKSEHIVHSSIESIEEYLRQNFSDPLLNVTSLADRFGLNRSYLSQKFKAQTGKTPIECLNRIRIEKAKEMIMKGDSNMAEVAAACGYYDNHALNVVFKKYEGVPPSKYRASQGIADKMKMLKV